MAKILNNINILLMEDEIDLGETLQDILKKAGYQVTWVKNGIEASTITYVQEFDLYIFDINIPELDGLALLDFLRNVNDKTPTIFISALIDFPRFHRSCVGMHIYI